MNNFKSYALMKKTILLMGVLVSFLSCQKDTDKACPYLNTTEKHVNDLGVPIQTCGETVTVIYGMMSTCSTGEPNGDFPWGDTYYEQGTIKIYNDNSYLYIQLFDKNKNQSFNMRVIPSSASGLDSQSIKKYEYSSDNSLIKIPLSEFPVGDSLRIINWWGYYVPSTGGDEYCVYSAFFHEKDLNFLNFITYNVSPCCETNE